MKRDKMPDLPDPYIISQHCPTCGAATDIKMSPEWLLGHFTGLFGRILSFLIEARRTRAALPTTDLIRRLYGDDAPVEAHRSIMVRLKSNRAKLAELGWYVIGPSETTTGYRLVPLEQHGVGSPFSRRKTPQSKIDAQEEENAL